MFRTAAWSSDEASGWKLLVGDLDFQLEQLAMNSGHTPEQFETLSMPPNDSFGFDDDQWLLPVASETTTHNPEKTIFCSNFRPFLMTFPDGQLLAQRKVFQS